MASLREWIYRLWGTLRPSRRHDRELEQELRLHLELAAEDAQRRMDPANAARAAVIRAGGITQTMEALRDQRGLPLLDDLARDVRHGFRFLRRNPTLAGAAVISLALGIGVNSAVFSIVDAELLRPLPVPRRWRGRYRQRRWSRGSRKWSVLPELPRSPGGVTIVRWPDRLSTLDLDDVCSVERRHSRDANGDAGQ